MRDIRREASHVQNVTLKLKAVPFVPSFQKVEKGVWTDNSVRMVRDFQSITAWPNACTTHIWITGIPKQKCRKMITIRTPAIKNHAFFKIFSHRDRIKHVLELECAKIFNKTIFSCTLSFTYWFNRNGIKHRNSCAVKVLLCHTVPFSGSFFYPEKLLTQSVSCI